MVGSCRKSLEIQDELVLAAFEGLVAFYAAVGKADEAIRMFDEYYEECREVLGGSVSLFLVHGEQFTDEARTKSPSE